VLPWMVRLTSQRRREERVEYIANGSAAGVGRTDVTPSAGTMLEGYHRPAPLSGVLDRLFATVLVLNSAAAGPAALVAIDHIGLTVAETRPLRERVAKVLGISAGRVMVCFSHTHSGARSTSGYLASLEESVLWATQQAAAALRPARVGWGTGGVEAGVNRRPRDADGRAFMGEASDHPVDRRLGVLRVDDGTGTRSRPCCGTVPTRTS
jgi:hypothetical protein